MLGCRLRVDLILIVLCLHTQLISGQDGVQTEQPKPVIHRLRRLDEQVSYEQDWARPVDSFQLENRTR